MDHFKSREDVVEAFVRFVGGLKPGAPLVACAEDEGVQAMMKKIPGAEARGPFFRYG